jgi:hypothetical protein
MLDNHHELISTLNSSLLSQGYSPVVVRNYCTYASGFLDYLVLRGVPVADVIDVQVEQYLRHAIVKFEKERGRRPSARWYRFRVPGFMRCCDLLTVNGRQQSSLSARSRCARFAVCDEYEIWLREERGLARSSVAALMWKPGTFLPGRSIAEAAAWRV